LNLTKAIDRMEATVVASVRAVRPVAQGAVVSLGQMRPAAPATPQYPDFEAPTEATSAGLLF
jgi:hypothetical protein